MKVLNNVEIGANYSKPKRGNDNNSHLITFRQNNVKKVEYLQNRMEEVKDNNKNSANSENISNVKEYSSKIVKFDKEIQDVFKDNLLKKDVRKVEQKNKTGETKNIKSDEKELRNINFKNSVKTKVEKEENTLAGRPINSSENINLRNLKSKDGDIFIISDEVKKLI